MSFSLADAGERRFVRSGSSSSAFIVGALFLVVFLAASVAMFVQLDASAAAQAAEGLELSRAVAAASDAAERFAADPTGMDNVAVEDDLVVVCDVYASEATPPQATGMLYLAEITVFRADDYALDGAVPNGEPIYEIETACYVGGGQR